MFGGENSQMYSLFISYTNENEKVYSLVSCGIHWLYMPLMFVWFVLVLVLRSNLLEKPKLDLWIC